MARREERAYREYVSDEQRSQVGCIGVQSWHLYSWTGPNRERWRSILTKGNHRAPYSARSTVIGSTRVARQTGTSAANPATIASTDQELASDTQSNGSTP